MKLVKMTATLMLMCCCNLYAADSELDKIKHEKAAKQSDPLMEAAAALNRKPKNKSNVIYQWIDENGNTVISDKPHPGAKQIVLPKSQPYKPVTNDIPKINIREPAAAKIERRKIFNTTPPKLKIISPVNQSWLNNNLGNVEIVVTVDPYLRQGQLLVIKLDNAAVSKGNISSVNLEGLDRGSHQIQVEVVMGNSGKVIAKTSSTFNVRRPTVNR